jgi:hypothetical protein
MKVCIVILKLIGQSNYIRLAPLTLGALICLANLPATSTAEEPPQKKPATQTDTEHKGTKKPAENSDAGTANAGKGKKDQNWTALKDKWVVSQFGGDGPVVIKDKLITLGLGDPLTGIRWEADVPKDNYEVELEARRREGFDFFCALTFPVGKKHVSFILGGWGGGVVGISSVDGFDASENETTSFRNFETDRWYKVRARVDANQIQCWIDDKPAAEQIRKGHEFDIRYEMDQCVPLGVAAFQCKSEVRNIRIRKLTTEETKAAAKEAAKTEE